MGNGYFLGMDMGTGSVGWAVTDDQYHLRRAHGKDLWGIRLFENANTAEERRVARCARRRLDRRNERIRLLQELFAEEICKVDPGFFLRLKESFYAPEDKRDADGEVPVLPYNLFVDENYTDKEYHKEYPTIYHLRKELMQSEEAKDVRLVYLALHHIIKHRGHFLFAGLDASNIMDFRAAFSVFVHNIQDEELEVDVDFTDDMINTICEILKNEYMTKSRKAAELVRVLGANNKCEKAICKLITGCKVKLSDIFGDETMDDYEKNAVDFSASGYETDESILEDELGEKFYIIASAKAIYDWSVLVNILNGESSISIAKTKIFEKHKKDLQYLKSLVRKHMSSAEYRKMFVVSEEKLCNYVAYIGMTKKNGKKVPLEGKRCTQEDFYTFLKKFLANKIPQEDMDKISEEIDLRSFLPKQVSKENSVVPYQLQLEELRKIVKNASNYLPVVKENAEKIEQIMTFRVPYYVGPVGKNPEGKSLNAWAVRRSDERVLPWNFEQVIDVEQSAEKFIRRMTNKCTYLYGEDVLPKESLLYSKFTVLNELNNLRIDGEKISVELKQSIYENLFQRERKVTNKKLRTYLKKEGVIADSAVISGIDGDFKSSLKSYHDFKEKLTGAELTEAQKEEIILNISLFGDDKALLKKRIRRMFPALTDNMVKNICGLSYSGWGRLSRTFLEELLAPVTETGEPVSIIRAMWETNNNLMQLLGNDYLYTKQIEDFNGGTQSGELTYAAVDEMYVSPAVKRQIWQTLQIVNELKKVLGEDPKKIFVEVARENTDLGRTLSRKKFLLDLYKRCKDEEREWVREIESREEHDYKSDRLYLYYTQKGRCMYCGKHIELQNLWDRNTYDIDHIYPQSKVMDDSIKNRVLTCHVCNERKGDVVPIAGDVREKMQPFWKSLKEENYIDETKYQRLIRNEEFSAQELAGFIERQLVETRQSTKAVAAMLKRAMPNTEIVYSKAKTTAEFKQHFDIVKVREVNDLHHAHDAYLNIVVGNTYHTKFNGNAAAFISNNPGRSYNLKKMFDRDVCQGQYFAWKAGEQGTIGIVRKTLKKNSILFTRRSYEVTGALFDLMLMKKGKGQVPIKGSDERLQSIEKYGGYNKATGAYFVLVESDGKKNRKKRTIEFVPLHRKQELEKDDSKMMQYLTEECELINPRIILKKIKTDTLFEVDGFKMHLSGRTGVQLVFKNANQLLVGDEDVKTLKKVVKVVTQMKMNKNYSINEYDEISVEMLMHLYNTYLQKLRGNLYGVRLGTQVKTLEEGMEVFASLSLENKCKVIFEIAHLFQCQSGAADLSLIGGPGKAGIVKISKDISTISKAEIINQSITGIYEQRINLLTV